MTLKRTHRKRFDARLIEIAHERHAVLLHQVAGGQISACIDAFEEFTHVASLNGNAEYAFVLDAERHIRGFVTRDAIGNVSPSLRKIECISRGASLDHMASRVCLNSTALPVVDDEGRYCGSVDQADVLKVRIHHLKGRASLERRKFAALRLTGRLLVLPAQPGLQREVPVQDLDR